MVISSPLPAPVRHQAEEHAAIVAAIEARDADAAEHAAAACLHKAVAALQHISGTGAVPTTEEA